MCAGRDLMEKTLTEDAQLLQKISKVAAMRRDWETRLAEEPEYNSRMKKCAEFSKEATPEVKKEESIPNKLEEEHIKSRTTPSVDFAASNETNKRSISSAKPLREFEPMDWVPIDYGEVFDKRRPFPNQKRMARALEVDFPPERKAEDSYDLETTGEIFQKLFGDDEVDPEHIAEVKRIMGIKLEASPYARLAEVYAIGVTEPPKIIPYCRLSRSTWPLSNNKELLSRFHLVKPGKSHTTGSLICAKPTRRRDQSTTLHYIKGSQVRHYYKPGFSYIKVNMTRV
jgi:hypothetical protein